MESLNIFLQGVYRSRFRFVLPQSPSHRGTNTTDDLLNRNQKTLQNSKSPPPVAPVVDQFDDGLISLLAIWKTMNKWQ